MSSPSSSKADGKIRRADPSTIQNKFLVGYQGWFTCAGDGEPVGPGHHGWLHWFNRPLPDGGRPNVDLWPDVSSYAPSELYEAPGLKSASGEQLYLFSSRHQKTVQRHFHWMAEHGVDGAFLQRFLGQCDLERGTRGVRQIRDEVGDRVREAAEKEGRVFAIMYDISGVDPDRILGIIERDWTHLVREKHVLDSPNYLREKGKVVVALWGFGFSNAGHTPEIVRAVTSFIRKSTPGGAYIMGGVPSQWRTSEGDADPNPGFLDVWLTEFDAISPWTVGRYSNEDEADRFASERTKGDMELLKRKYEAGMSKKIDYITVVLPGGSGYNLSEGKWGFNNIKRNGGRFLWRQISNTCRLGVRIIYGAMWDEYDEGTAFLPAVPSKRLLPAHDKFPFLALDADDYDLPSDWYMRICGLAAEGLRSDRLIQETFPVKELQDYWSTRPKLENEAGSASASGKREDGSDAGQSYQDWLAAQQEDRDAAPPPPYSLVEDGVVALLPPDPSAEGASEVSDPASPSSTGIAATSVPSMALSSPTSTTSAQIAHAYPHSAINEPVTSLTNEFGRHTLSGSTRPLSPSSRPPTHPSRPVRPSSATVPSIAPTSPTSTTSAQIAHAYPHPAINDPVTSLTNEFGRQTLSGSTRPLSPSSRPPTHPSRPVRPSSAHQAHQQPNTLSSASRPGSTAPHHPGSQSQTGCSRPSLPSVAEPPSSGPWSQATLSPVGWNLPPQQALPSLYPPGPMTDNQKYNALGSPSFAPPETVHSSIGTPPHGPAHGIAPFVSPNFPVPTVSESYYPTPPTSQPGSAAGPPYSFPTAGEEKLTCPTPGFPTSSEWTEPRPYVPPPLPSPMSSYYPAGPHAPSPAPPHGQYSHHGSNYYPPPSHNPPPSPFHHPQYGTHPHGAPGYGDQNHPYHSPGYQNPPYGAPGPQYATYAPAPPGPPSVAGGALDMALNAVGTIAGPNARIRVQQGLASFQRTF